METEIGPTLREARIRRKIDLTAVEQQTKIRIRYLRALENEEWDLLPGGSYTRSFIRTYASFLGLDGERLADEHRLAQEEEARGGYPRGDAAAMPSRLPEARGGGPRIGSGTAAALIAAGLIALLLVLGLTGDSDDGGGSPTVRPAGTSGNKKAKGKDSRPKPRKTDRVSLDLNAIADVWVCVLDAKGKPLLDGQILAAGAREGPFRSARFDVSFGNGEVAMQVNGKELPIEETPNPVGYRVTAQKVRPLAELERPTCT